MSSDEPESYLIIGAGVFGASTALYLKREIPSAKVLLIDRTPFPCPSAASHDLSKIVRADYDDKFYMKLALEALKSWREDDLYKRYFHETGMLFAEDFGIGARTFANMKELAPDVPVEMLRPEEARKRFGGVFSESDWTGVKKNYWNPTSGWGEAELALRDVIQAAVDEGVRYVEDSVSTLLFDDDGSCIGVKTTETEYTADKIILCTGAYSAKLLADSAPNNSDLQMNGRMVAVGAVSCIARFDESEKERLADCPVNYNGIWYGESAPFISKGLLKFNSEKSFTHNVYHKASGQTISIPPAAVELSTWGQDVPQGLKDEVRNVVSRMYGDAIKGLEIESYRICWDAVTPNQSWIISPHPACANLYIAGGGSFHAWKFLPTLGKYVVQMLQGRLDVESQTRWAWDRENTGAAIAVYLPARDLIDVEGAADLLRSGTI